MKKHWINSYGADVALQNFDLQHNTSLVRELEMTLDHFAIHQGHVMQFFRDLRTYGLSEAVMYAKSGGFNESPDGEESFRGELAAVVARIHSAVGYVPPPLTASAKPLTVGAVLEHKEKRHD